MARWTSETAPKGRPDQEHALDDMTRRRAVKRYSESEETVVQIAKAFHISERTLLRYVVEAGVKLRHLAKIPEEHFAPIVQLYQQGLTSEQIARKFNCSAHSVLRRLRKAGVKARKGRAAHRRDLRPKYGKGLISFP